MASLLSKFRIDFSDVTVIPDVTKKAKDETREEFKVRRVNYLYLVFNFQSVS